MQVELVSPERILFSGDVGRYNAVLAKDPDPCPDADYVVVESFDGRTWRELNPL